MESHCPSRSPGKISRDGKPMRMEKTNFSTKNGVEMELSPVLTLFKVKHMSVGFIHIQTRDVMSQRGSNFAWEMPE